MVPVDSVGVPRDPTYSGTLREATTISPTGLSPSMARLSSAVRLSCCFVTPMWKALQPRRENPRGLGYFQFARRYYGNRVFFLFQQLLRCFSSLRCRRTPMNSVYDNSGIPGSTLVCQLPQAYRRLPRPSSAPDTKTSPIRP